MTTMSDVMDKFFEPDIRVTMDGDKVYWVQGLSKLGKRAVYGMRFMDMTYDDFRDTIPSDLCVESIDIE